MTGFIGLFFFIIFLFAFMRMDTNISRISETLLRIEKELGESKKEKK